MRQRSNLFFALSVLLIIVAAVWFWQRRSYVAATAVGEGVVRATANGGLGVQLNGTTQFVQLEKPLFGSPAEGAPVRVRYVADADGSSATLPSGRIDSVPSLWLGPALVLLTALLLLLAGAGSALSQRRRGADAG